jgi:hypothetical protein
MSELEIAVATRHASMAEAKPFLEAAFSKHFPGGLLQRRWEGETLVVFGPGATGTITFEGGRLIGRAQLKPPASLMKAMIEQKVGAALADGAI